jgi:hypothetical protein
MRIAIPNKEAIDPAQLKKVVITGMVNTGGPNPPVFSVELQAAEFLKLSDYELADDVAAKVDKVEFKYYHPGAIKLGVWMNNQTKIGFVQHNSLPLVVKRATLEADGFNEAYVRQHSGWIDVTSSEQQSIPASQYLNLELLSAQDREYLLAEVRLPESGILTLDSAVFSHKGLVYSEDMSHRYIELTRFSDIDNTCKSPYETTIYRAFHSKCDENVGYVPGTCLNLLPLFANNNYCHSLLDLAALLNILDLAQTDITSFDHILVPENRFLLVKDFFNYTKIDYRKILYGGIREVEGKFQARVSGYFFDQLVSPSFSGYGSFYKSGSFNFLRKSYKDQLKASCRKRKLFIAREGAGRDVHNSVVFEELLATYGFETVFASRQVDLPHLMAQASVVIGAHGAGMANCVFCSPGATLVDLLPSYYCKPYFASLAQIMDLNYIGIVCKEAFSEKNKIKRVAPESHRSFSVNIPQLKNVLDGLL